MFQIFYGSAWHHPGLLVALGLTGLLLLPTLLARTSQNLDGPTQRFIHVWAYLFAIETLLDAILTGNVPLGLPTTGAAATLLPTAFVFLGDLRFFWLVEGVSTPTTRGGLGRALRWTVVIPLGTAVLAQVFSGTFANARVLYLVYEGSFVLLATGWLYLVLPRRAAALPQSVRVGLAFVCRYVIAYYALWATADVLILQGAFVELGFAIRLVANVLYYAGLVPVAIWSLGRAGEARVGGVANATLLLVVLSFLGSSNAYAAETAVLQLGRGSQTIASLDVATLKKLPGVKVISLWDPYYQKDKRYVGAPISAVLQKAFGSPPLPQEPFILRAQDGYTVPTDGARLLEPGGYIVWQDVDVRAWEPIGPKQVSPAPFYMVWENPAQKDTHVYPWPYQLVRIEVTSFEEQFARVIPKNTRDAATLRGLTLFRKQCINCHAINRQGGKIGPDLNVPMSIVEYRPVEQIKQYIKDPMFYRYGAMPPHPGLTEQDLNALVAYFRAMSHEKAATP